jgi:hypothetical protein
MDRYDILDIIKAPFKHDPLVDPEQEIRLLQVTQPSHNYRMSLEISTWKSKDAPVYNAISYTWGEANDDCFVQANGNPLLVRNNCYRALSQASSHMPLGAYFWIDAICINQDNIEEKSFQVQRMGETFAGAETVFVWLGANIHDDEILAGAAEELRTIIGRVSTKPRLTTYDRYLVMKDWISKKGRIHAFKAYSALGALATRKYWSRVWIVQEISVAKRKVVLCGNETLPWDCLETFGRLGLPLRSFYFHVVMSCSVPEPVRLDRAIAMFKSFQCTDVRDRLYGIMGLVDRADLSSAELRVDYSVDSFNLLLRVIDSLPHFEVDVVLGLMEMLDQNASRLGMRYLISLAQQGWQGRDEWMIAVLKHTSQVRELSVPFILYCQIDEDAEGRLVARFSIDTDANDDFTPNATDSDIWMAGEVATNAPQTIYFKSQFGYVRSDGRLCAGARKGDILVSQQNHRPETLLVIRKLAGDDFSVVGQALIHSGDIHLAADAEYGNLSFRVSLSAPEVLLLWGQDYYGHDEDGSAKYAAQWERARTPVVLSEPLDRVKVVTQSLKTSVASMSRRRKRR